MAVPGPLLDLRSPMGIAPIALSRAAPAPAAKAGPKQKATHEMLASQRSYRVSPNMHALAGSW